MGPAPLRLIDLKVGLSGACPALSLGYAEALGRIVESTSGRPRTAGAETGEESMSKQQQLELDAILRQGQLDLGADVPTLRAVFYEGMARVPVAGYVNQKPTTIGGVGAVEVTIDGTDAANVILYFHGGVYVIGSAATSVPLVGGLARRTGAKAVTLESLLS